MEMDGHTLTLRLPANNLDTLYRVCLHWFVQAVINFFSISFSHTEVSYTERTRLSTQSLPVHITSVRCYNSSKSLLDCDYYELPSSTTTSIDISISCGSDIAGESDRLSSFICVALGNYNDIDVVHSELRTLVDICSFTIVSSSIAL